MTRWLRINEDKHVGYLHMPGEVSKANDTPNARHITAFRDGVMRYLYTRKGSASDKNDIDSDPKAPAQEEVAHQSKYNDVTDDPANQLPKDQRISYCHFHPLTLEKILKEKDAYMLKRYRWRISTNLGEVIGLKPQDLCPDPDLNGEMTYFALPNYPLEAAMADVEAAELNYARRFDENKKSQNKLASKIAGNPRKYALEIHDLRETKSRLEAEVQELKSKLKHEQGIRCKIEQKNKIIDKRLTNTKHQLKKVTESKKIMKARGRPPKKEAESNKEGQQFNASENSLPEMQMYSPELQMPQAQSTRFLNEINYPKDISTHEDKWKFRFQQLIEYQSKFGNCDVPRGWGINKSLGKWRVLNSQGRLSQSRIDKLNSLGFVWRKYTQSEELLKAAMVP
eukprot:scaffold23035_cov73-Cyclotella_meneghiniana.AAC.7